jgi:hypothetical protein
MDRDHVRDDVAVVVPRETPPATSSTVEPASAVPDTAIVAVECHR